MAQPEQAKSLTSVEEAGLLPPSSSAMEVAAAAAAADGLLLVLIVVPEYYSGVVSAGGGCTGGARVARLARHKTMRVCRMKQIDCKLAPVVWFSGIPPRQNIIAQRMFRGEETVSSRASWREILL